MSRPGVSRVPDQRSHAEAWQMVTENMGLAWWVARRFPFANRDVVESVGADALFRASCKWDASRGVKFGTYASAVIWRAYYHEGRGRVRHQQAPDWVFAEWRSKPPAEDTPEVDNLFDAVTPNEADVLRMRFWLGLTLQSIGDIMGVSKERVRQIQVGALRKMRAVA